VYARSIRAAGFFGEDRSRGKVMYAFVRLVALLVLAILEPLRAIREANRLEESEQVQTH
jgi:hypothetical protein